MKNKGVLWITTTAVFIALLIGVQAAAGPLGQLVTGSLVNLLLIAAGMLGGLATGLTVTLVSPVFAKLLGIGPMWTIVPFIMAGNAVLVLIWHALGKRTFANRHVLRAMALVLAAAAKFATLYLGIARLAVPLLLELPAAQAAAVSHMFAWPQLFTALIGGALAMAVLPLAERAQGWRKEH